MVKLLDKIFKKSDKTIVWDHTNVQRDGELIWRVPNPDIPSIAEYDQFSVKSYEEVIFYAGGRGQRYTEGTYEFEKEDKHKGSELVFFDPRLVDLTFAVGRLGNMPPITSDGFKVGCSGILSIQIIDPEALIRNIITGNPNFDDKMLKERIRARVVGSFKTVLRNYTLRDFVLNDRHLLTAMMQTDMQEDLKFMGLDLNSLIIENAAFSPEDKELIDTIIQEVRNKLEALYNRKTELENRKNEIKKRIAEAKHKLDDLISKMMDGEIEDEEYDKAEKRMERGISKFEERLKDIDIEMKNVYKEISDLNSTISSVN